MQEVGEFLRMHEILRSCRNFRACEKIRALREIFMLCEFLCFLFSAQNDSVLLIFLFALDVILLTWAFLVFHFIARLYIAILCTVDLTDDGIEKKTRVLCFYCLLSLSLFLSFSLTFSATDSCHSRCSKINKIYNLNSSYCHSKATTV